MSGVHNCIARHRSSHAVWPTFIQARIQAFPCTSLWPRLWACAGEAEHRARMGVVCTHLFAVELTSGK